MPRAKQITRNHHLHTTIPVELHSRLEQFLMSEVEGRVPQGAYQQFICERIQEFFNRLDGITGESLLNELTGDHQP